MIRYLHPVTQADELTAQHARQWTESLSSGRASHRIMSLTEERILW